MDCPVRFSGHPFCSRIVPLDELGLDAEPGAGNTG